MAKWNPSDFTQNPVHSVPIIEPSLKFWGNEKTMNLNNIVLTNVQASPYFRVELAQHNCVEELIDQIYYKVGHLEPWEKGTRKTSGQIGMCGAVRGVGAGGVVSSAFCILYKLFTIKPTKSQLKLFLNHRDSPYIRGIGFMFIRYCLHPHDLWKWFEPYLDDEEEIDLKAGGGNTTTIGKMLRRMLIDIDWYGTLFPRIPLPIQKIIDENQDEKDAEKNKNSDIHVGSSKSKKEHRNNERKHRNNHHRSRSRSRDHHRKHRRHSPVYKDKELD